MDKRKGYVLLLINAGVRNSKRVQKISAAAPLRVMTSRYNPASKRAFRVLLLELVLPSHPFFLIPQKSHYTARA